MPKYNVGMVYEPAEKNYIGIKHESLDKDQITAGKFFFYFFHAASARNTVGSEFTLNWASKVMEARFGLSHKFDD
jgi:hypothetical protein